MNRRFDAVADLSSQMVHRFDQRFEGLEHRTDRLENRMTSLEYQLFGINKALADGDRSWPR